MPKSERGLENEREPGRDISQELTSIVSDARPYTEIRLLEFIDSLDDEPALSVTVNWISGNWARFLKAFIEHPASGQTRTAAIRATRKQMEQAQNVFASGVKWIEIKE